MIDMNIFQYKKKIKKNGLKKVIREIMENIKKNDKYNAFISINEEVLEEAEKLKINGKNKKPLHGIPISIKDNIAVKNQKLTCGSNLLANFISPYDATVIKRLKNAGALIVGKTNMDEFAMGASNEYSAYGPVKNPLNPEYVPGGSSGGSAASVSGNFVPVSLGSDTGGSVRQPASFTGCVGFKPTYGRVSRYGLTAFSSSLDQIGPITKNVDDTSLIYRIISGKDNKDSTSSEKKIEEYEANRKKKFSIGVPFDLIEDINEDIKKDFLETIEQLKNNGHTIKKISFETIKYAVPTYQIISTAEASSNLARFDGIIYGNRKQNEKNLVSVTRDRGFGIEVKRRCMVGTFVLSSGYSDKYYKNALKAKKIISKELKNHFKNLDLLALPTTPNKPFKIGEKSDDVLYLYKGDLFTIPANLSGLPAISIPVKKNGDFYSSIQFMSSYFQEGILFDIGREIEKMGGKK